jgi:hypothetical protein
LEFGVGEIGLVRSLEISQAKAIAKFQGSGAAQEKMGFKMEANRVVGFFPRFVSDAD